MLKGRHLISPNDFSLIEINEILSLGQEISISPTKFSNVCEKGKCPQSWSNAASRMNWIILS